MGGIGTNQQKHREKKQENQYSRGLGDGGDWHKAKKNIEKTKKKQKNKNNIPEVLGWGGSHQEFPNIVFFGFLDVFLVFWPKMQKPLGKQKKHIPEVLGTGG